MVEILGSELSKALSALEIEGKCTYKRKKIETEYDEIYEVWKISDDDFEKLCNVKDDDWLDDWGWWRYSKGSNIIGVGIESEMIINGKDIIAWYNEDKLEDEFNTYDAEVSKDEYITGYCKDQYENENLLTYFCDEFGASMKKNIVALAVDLARLNNMTMSELFQKYIG